MRGTEELGLGKSTVLKILNLEGVPVKPQRVKQAVTIIADPHTLLYSSASA